MITSLNCSILILGYGYADYYRYEGKTKAVTGYTFDSAGASAYDYSQATGEFTVNSGPNHGYWAAVTAVNFPMQSSSDLFPSYFDSVNIVFNKETVNANDLQMFLKASVSCAGINISWASDSNAIFQTNQATRNLHETVSETGDWTNTNIYYKGQKQIFIKEIKPLSRIGRSIKFRVIGNMNEGALDEIKIHHIEVLPTGIIFMGDNNA